VKTKYLSYDVYLLNIRRLVNEALTSKNRRLELINEKIGLIGTYFYEIDRNGVRKNG